MLLHPAVIALLGVSVLMSFMLLYAAYYGVLILRRWDLASGSEQQLALERRTYLISTILTYAFGFQLLSLFLYMFTADNLHTFFVGAMCAAGTLNVNGYGYPTLVLKIFNFLAAGTWLVLNYADNRAYDYPLIKKKYLFLIILAPLVVAETVMLANYLLRLRPDVITSCCGSLFSVDAGSIQSDLASLPATPMKFTFYVAMACSLASGLPFYRKGKGAYLFSALTSATFVVSVAAVVSFISPYLYELPTHHCPFCILQGEYGYIGYPLYVALLGGGVSGIGVGVLNPFRNVASLREIIPPVQKKLTCLALCFYTLFVALVTFGIVSSNLVL
jgi:hypothetical protein